MHHPWPYRFQTANENGPSSPVLIIALIAVVSLVFITFIWVLFRLLYNRGHLCFPSLDPHQANSSLPSQQATYSTPQPPAFVRLQRLAQNSGLTISELSQVAPVTSFEKQNEEEDTCPVCLDDMQKESKTRRLPCTHAFDAQCIEEWASKANRCPVCNTPIIPDEALQKSRLASIENHPPVSSSSAVRQRRRRTRGENGTFQIRVQNSARAQSVLPHSDAPPQSSVHTNISQQSD